MFVGASGVGRVVQRTAELMNAFDTADVEPHGGINLDTLQRYINFHFSVSLDLFGSELSTNAANYYASGIKGRFAEQDYDDDHVLTDGDRELLTIRGDRLFEEVVPARSAVNADLRDDYIADCAKGLRRWNRILDEHDIDTELALPHMGFNREVGAFSSAHITPDGTIVGTPEWAQRSNDWLPSKGERAHVSSLMSPQVEPGQMADWIAPPSRGINTRPVDYEYVRL